MYLVDDNRVKLFPVKNIMKWSCIKPHASAFAATLICLSTASAFAEERLYQGKTFSEWVNQIDMEIPIAMGHEPEYWRAIQFFGTNEIPKLIQWIKSDSTALEDKREADREKPLAQGKHVPIFGPATYGSVERAIAVFGILGSSARSAIPALTQIAVHSHDRIQYESAIHSLSLIEPDSLHAFETILTKSRPEARAEAVGWLPIFHTNVVAILPAIVNCLTGKDGNVGDIAADELSRLEVPDAIVCPMLTNALPVASAPTRLRIYRCLFWRCEGMSRTESNESSRKETIRLLQAALNDKSYDVRDFATNALHDFH